MENNTKATQQEIDEYLEKTLNKLKTDPQYDLFQEFGKLLMKNVLDLTPAELTRYKELEILLEKNQLLINCK